MKSKLIVFLFSILLVCGPYIHGQGKDDNVNTITSECNAIDADSGYQVKMLRNDDLPFGERAQGGRVITGYFKNSTLYKIIDVVGLPSGLSTSTYYFWGDHLIYDNETETIFSKDDNGRYDYTQSQKSYEGNFYYNQDKLINSKVTGKKKFSDNRKLTEKMNNLQKNYISLFARSVPDR